MSESEELIHQDFTHYYEQHSLAGSLEVYLPLVKMDLMMDYVCKAPMGILEEYICRCVKQGMTDRYGIMDALALDGEIVDRIVEKLIGESILQESTAGKLEFVDTAYMTQTEKLRSIQSKKQPVTWCYKGLMNADKKIDTHMRALEDALEIENILEIPHIFYLLPNVLLEVKPVELRALNPKMLRYEGEEQEEVLDVMHLDILKERTVMYEAYNVLFFKGVEGNVKLLVHGSQGEQKVDEAFTRTLQRLYDRSELFNQMRFTTTGDENRLVELNKQIGFTNVVK